MYRSILVASCAGLMCWTAGCVTQVEHDAMARTNLQMQDKLNASQAERVKARTQVALLRQEVLQARQAQQEVQDRVDGMGREIEVLKARIDVQAEAISRSQKGAPQTQVTVSLSPETLDKLIQRVQALTEENNRLRSEKSKLQYEVTREENAKEISALTTPSKIKTAAIRPSSTTAPPVASPAGSLGTTQ